MYQVINNLPVFGIPLDNAVQQMQNCMPEAEYSVLMADHHYGYTMPVGGVCVYRGKIAPAGVGFDIGCGNLAVRLGISAEYVQQNIQAIMDEIWEVISFGIGRKNKEPVQHELFTDPAWDIEVASTLKDKAQDQLGTVGSGNHYVDLLVDDQQQVWCGVHFGSRGLGHSLATYYIAQTDGDKNRLGLLNVDSQLGQEYIAAMKLAGRFAYAGREWVCDRVAKVLAAPIVEEVHNHHNYAWEEGLNGDKVWVVRKGATPAYPGQRGFVGGSMGDDAVIIEGLDSIEAKVAFHSTVHGAGRVMSRTAASGKSKWKKGRLEGSGGLISDKMMMEWIGKKGVVLKGAGTDEAPQAYKRLDEVLAAHNNSIKVVRTLHPIGVAMAGSNEHDPWKD